MPLANKASVTLKSAGSKTSWAMIPAGIKPRERMEDTRMSLLCSANIWVRDCEGYRPTGSQAPERCAPGDKSQTEVAERVVCKEERTLAIRSYTNAGHLRLMYSHVTILQPRANRVSPQTRNCGTLCVREPTGTPN
jgi:hypothetical protein